MFIGFPLRLMGKKFDNNDLNIPQVMKSVLNEIKKIKTFIY